MTCVSQCSMLWSINSIHLNKKSIKRIQNAHKIKQSEGQDNIVGTNEMHPLLSQKQA